MGIDLVTEIQNRRESLNPETTQNVQNGTNPTLPEGRSGSKARNWVFTLFPKEDDDIPWDPHTIAWDEVSPTPRGVVAGLERAKSGRLHWQGFIAFTNAVRLASVKGALGSRDVHLEIGRGTPAQAIEYCKKSDTGICWDDEGGDKILFIWPEGFGADDCKPGPKARRDKDAEYSEAIALPTLDEALLHIQSANPRDWCLYGSSIQRNLKLVYELRDLEPRRPKEYGRPFFHGLLAEKALCLFGKAGTGKTEFGLDHFKFPLLIRHTDDLKRINPKTDGLVFDDLSFNRWSPQNVIHLLDLAHDSTINVKHSTVTIKAGMPRIFTCNRVYADWIPEAIQPEENEAIRRRIHVLIVNANLY